MHTIRLRGFWTSTTDANGRTQHSRNFGSPRSLDPGETVWLTGEGLPASCEFLVNGQSLGSTTQASQAFEFEITSLLKPRNVLTLIMASGSMQQELRLEIRVKAASSS
jgi:hypothetical protein